VLRSEQRLSWRSVWHPADLCVSTQEGVGEQRTGQQGAQRFSADAEKNLVWGFLVSSGFLLIKGTVARMMGSAGRGRVEKPTGRRRRHHHALTRKHGDWWEGGGERVVEVKLLRSS
jgi:hypothetical protein